MLLYLDVLALLLLQPALLSSAVLTTPSRGCPTCKSQSTQSQPTADSNSTAPAVGEPCGVYTVGCAAGLRCAPSEDEPRPLRALLEGRGVCTNASGVGPTENVQTVGKMKFRHVFKTHRFLIHLSVFERVTSLHFIFNQKMYVQSIPL